MRLFDKAFTTEAQRHREKLRFVLALLCVLCVSVVNPVFTGSAVAREALPLAPDAVTEKRLVEISSELRCLVCQNESLAASNAELAHDLRREIRAQVKDGKSDSEIMAFMVERYGDFVRYRPPLKASTLLLWFGPGLLLVAGLTTLLLTLRRRNRAISDAPLSAGEKSQADRLLKASESARPQDSQDSR